MPASTLIFGWGNPSRGDDALGPMFVERLQSLAALHPEWGALDCLTDFQLQVEHALDLRGRKRVLFVDASFTAPPPFNVISIYPAKGAALTTHAMTPQAVMQVYAELEDEAPPPAWLLAIRGERFELGESISPMAGKNLSAALAWTENWLTG